MQGKCVYMSYYIHIKYINKKVHSRPTSNSKNTENSDIQDNGYINYGIIIETIIIYENEGTPSHATTWMSLKNLMVYKRSHTQESTY